jgi:protein TonB
MAFEAFRAQAAAPARAGRKRLWYALSIGFHGALLAVGVAYSFWHIEELSPPLLKITFLSAAPPPPAPPPPAGGGATAIKKKVTVKPKQVVQPKPEIMQPKELPKKEEPKEEPKTEDKGEKDGVKGGTIGGTPGGTIGGTPGGTIGGTPGGVVGAPPAASKFLPPNVGEGHRLSGDKGVMPVQLAKPGAVYRLLIKVCVSTAGNVDKLTIMKGSDPLADAEALRVIKTWRFRPFLFNGTAVPFCYPQAVEFRTE